jgi:hypothetical protein
VSQVTSPGDENCYVAAADWFDRPDFSGSSNVNEISRLFQAFLAPALFVSATALLILSINVRLMGVVSRRWQYVHAKHDAAKSGCHAEMPTQIDSIEQGAELIRRCFMLRQGRSLLACCWGWVSTGHRRH